MLQAILNKSHKTAAVQPPTSISKTIKIGRTRHTWHCLRSKGKLITNVLPWTPSHRWVGVGRLARTSFQQCCTDTECRLEDMPNAMDDTDEWRGRVREIRARSPTRWWWYKQDLALNRVDKPLNLTENTSVFQ